MTPVPPFPFLVGCGRSGTTLVRAMLDAHPAMAIPGESYFPVWLGRARHRYERTGKFDLPAFVDDLLDDPWFARWAVPEGQVRTQLAIADPGAFAEAVRQVYALYAHHHGKARYGDKTPTFVLHIPLLAKLFPEAVFVHILRDGRDVALSLLDAEWGPRSVTEAALHWRLHVESGRRAGGALEPWRYHEIRYERLIEDPEGVARTLAGHVGLDFDGSMLRYFERAPALLAGLPDPEEHQNLLRPPVRRIRDWRSQMSHDDVVRFESLAGDLLVDLGYETMDGRPSARLRLDAGAGWMGWKLRRAARRARSVVARMTIDRLRSLPSREAGRRRPPGSQR